MLKIWGRATSSNVQKVLWCCGELGIPFERVDLGGPFGGNQDSEYLALNPNGLVPTVQDGELILWESNTICRYLATTNNGERLYPARTRCAFVCRALDGLAAIDRRSADGCAALRFDPQQARGSATTPRSRRRAAKRLSHGRSSRTPSKAGPFLAGSDLSLAEIVMGTLVYRWHAFPLERPALKNLKSWYERMRERPAFKTYIEIPIT